MSGPIQRTITTGVAFMEEKATHFNESINLNRRRWEVLVSKLTQKVIDINKSILKTGKCTTVNVTSKTVNESEEPLVYYLGGSAYASYNRLIMENGGTDIFLGAPRTHDWDTSFLLNKNDPQLVQATRKIIFDTIQNEYGELNKDNYLDGNFEEINTKSDLENGEILLGVIGPKDHERIEVSYLADRKGTYENIRLNLVKKIGGTYEKNHIIEFILWFKKPVQDYIYSSVRLVFNDVTYFVAIPVDLIKSNLISLINRSINPERIAKCRQDYLRIKNFINNIGRIKSFMPDLIDDFNYVSIFLDKIKVHIPQCVEEKLDAGTFGLIYSNLVQQGKKNPLLDKLKKILEIDYKFYIIRVELERELEKQSLKTHLGKVEEEIPIAFENLFPQTSLTESEADPYYFYNKYLKYKQKYLKFNSS